MSSSGDVPRGGDRVQTSSVGLAILGVDAGRQHAVRLSFPERHLSPVIDHDVASLARGLRPDDALHRHHLPDVRVLHFVDVQGNVRLVVVGIGFEEVLFVADSPV